MNKTKIVFVLYHPSGLSNWVLKLQPFLMDNDLYVFHIGLLHQIAVSPIDGIHLFDISKLSYAGQLLLIKKIHPQLMVFLSFRSLMELVLQRICVKEKICKIYVEHGIFSRDTLHFRRNKLKREKKTVIKRQLAFLRSSLGCVIHSENIIKEFFLFYRVYIKGQFWLQPFNHYLLFSQRSFDIMRWVFDLQNDYNVDYVGYPIFKDEKQKQLCEKQISTDGGVLYIHQPLISDGIVSITYGDEKLFLVNMARILRPKFGNLTILIHPRADLNEYKQRFKDTDIDIVQSPNNPLMFINRSLIIGHYSTALLYGSYFKKPTIVLDYPTLKNDATFNEFFCYVKNAEEIVKMNIFETPQNRNYLIGDYNTFEHIAYKIQIVIG